MSVRTSLLSRRRPLAVLVAAASLTAFAGVGTASALRDAPAVPAPPAQPTRADQIQNIDQVKTAIKAYYGDTVSGTNPDGSVQHLPSPTGAYAREVAGVERRATSYLRRSRADHGARPSHARKAILLDVDDTSLNTYNYEIASSFVYNPVANGVFVDQAAFPEVFGMPALARKARTLGYRVLFLTGRPEAQRPGTEANLTKVGFPVVSTKVFLKDDAGQSWITCDTAYTRYDVDRTAAPSCSTIERKSQTRAHIERDLGYDIVANFGDQYSDLKGGHADRAFKLPNPMYYLP
jgi:hypothetical protein